MAISGAQAVKEGSEKAEITDAPEVVDASTDSVMSVPHGSAVVNATLRVEPVVTTAGSVEKVKAGGAIVMACGNERTVVDAEAADAERSTRL